MPYDASPSRLCLSRDPLEALREQLSPSLTPTDWAAVFRSAPTYTPEELEEMQAGMRESVRKHRSQSF